MERITKIEKEKLTLLQNHSWSTMNSNPLYVIVNLLCCGPFGICSGLVQPQKIKVFTTLVFYQHYWLAKCKAKT